MSSPDLPPGLAPLDSVRSLNPKTANLYDFEAIGIDGAPVHFDAFRDRVVLVVNTASACGFTPQFAGLEQLWERYRDRGLLIVGFPSNEFGAQDPGSNAEIATFCQKNYGVTFPMMRKVQVNGADAHPLFQWLKVQAPGLLGSEGVKWNFTKFLLGRDGKAIRRYASTKSPADIAADIETALAVASR